MQISDYLISYIGSTIPLIFYIIYYNLLSETKIKLKFKHFIFVPIISILGLLNTHFNYSYTKLLISFMIIFVNNQIVFKDNYSLTFVKTLVIYILIVFFEVILSIPIAFMEINNLFDFDSSIFLKMSYTLLIQFTILLICVIKSTNKIIKKCIKFSKNKYMNIIYLVLLLLMTVFLAYKFIFNFNAKTYMINILILLCFLTLLFILIYNEIKIKKVEKNQEVLLNFMTKYEKIIEKNRINRHEMLNNLLVLKSYKNKNSKSYENTLNNLIADYSKNGSIIKNIHDLPSGIKGILYYKLHEMEVSNINVFIKIMKNVNNFFKNIDDKEYKNICNIISILLDNAKEAAEESDKKKILIDFEILNNVLIMTVQNNFKGDIDIEKIKIMNYSTKGKNRGIGLYVVYNLINKSNKLELDQSVYNDYFISTLKIKN